MTRAGIPERSGSIEERIAGLVADKRALFKGLFEGATDELRFEGGRAIAAVLERVTEGVEGKVDPVADDGAEALLEVASDAEAAATATSESPSPDSVVVAEPPPEGGAPLSNGPIPDGDDQIARLFGAVSVNRRHDGSLVIEAPPEAARALASLFDGMSRLMAAAATTPEG